MSTGEVVLSDSGHNPVMLVRRDGSLAKVELSKGVALGVVDDFAFTQHSFALDPGDALVIYTDGATDARNPAGDLFGSSRIDRALGLVATAPVDSIVQTIVRTVSQFADGAPPEDDLTILALRYRGT